MARLPVVRRVGEGAAAGVGAVVAVAGTAFVALLLLDARRLGRLDRLTAAVVAMAAGAPARLAATPSGGLPVAVHSRIDLTPLGISVVGAVVLGALVLRRGREGLLLRGASAAVAFTAGIGMAAWTARGHLTLPTGASGAMASPACLTGGGLPGGLTGGEGLPGGGGLLSAGGRALDGGFVVGVGSAVWGAAFGALVVVGLCWLAARFPAVAGGLRGLRWPAVGAAVVPLVGAWVVGGAAAVGVGLLGFPLVMLSGLPWDVHTGGMLACVLDGGTELPTGGPLVLTSAVLALGFGVAVTAGIYRGKGSTAHVDLTDMLIQSTQSTCQSTRESTHPATAAAGTAGAGAPGGRDRPWRAALVRAASVGLAGGVLLVVLAVLARVSVGLSAQAFILTVPLVDVRLAPDPWVALGVGLVAGAMGSLLVAAFVSWRHDAAR
ncbi:hypothetical protein OWR29_03585 [Actinoplanes sp. Pm04-4]|uniref:Integral membrane protein n=1 Tax=Paractinoplanes pyxinae TaxID=2997416 RepID=A0ABT4AS56_9ACTN|nr:hypothetical protein [Actinoplanes pyxinae]MCY1137066.1 hypothetical protein [Actinoplanes pyxinae]